MGRSRNNHPMHQPPHEPHFLDNLRSELSNGRLWFDRAVVLVYAIAAGLSVVAFTMLGEWGFGLFERVYDFNRWTFCSGRQP